jgi:hypothetical protein
MQVPEALPGSKSVCFAALQQQSMEFIRVAAEKDTGLQGTAIIRSWKLNWSARSFSRHIRF